MQISLHDGNKTEWIKWVKFGLARRDQMKAAYELPEEERPKPNASIDINFMTQLPSFDLSIAEFLRKSTGKQSA
jgi:hypothetical protein